MFHFLKNTVMMPDFMARQANDDCVVISQWKDYQYRWPLNVVNNHIHCKNVFITFDAWYKSNFQNDYEFISWLYNTQTIGVRFYADCEAYAKLVIKWMSFVCPQLSIDQVYNFYKLSMMWYYVYQINLKMNTTDEMLVEYSTLIDEFKVMSFDVFKSYYDNGRVEITDELVTLKNVCKNYISNELKFAFFLNGDDSFRAMTSEHINKALVRCLKMEIEQYKYVNLFDLVYDGAQDDELFAIIKATSKLKPNDEIVEPSIEMLYQYGLKNDVDLLTYNNTMIREYHDIIANEYDLTDKLQFIVDIILNKNKKAEFVDCFSPSYMLYNLLIVRWIITMYHEKDVSLRNFVF